MAFPDDHSGHPKRLLPTLVPCPSRTAWCCHSIAHHADHRHHEAVSPGPALYRGKRVGRNKVPFDILKFRTMKVGSEAKIGKRLVQQDEDHYTSIGRF